MRRIKEYTAVYVIGAIGYSFLEILWRGVTHWTMTLTGGLCFLSYHIANIRCQNLKITKKCGVGCIIITTVEFFVGMVVNKRLAWNVWDYSERLFNIEGQICAMYSGLWFLLCIPLTVLSNIIRSGFNAKSIFSMNSPHIKKQKIMENSRVGRT